MNRTKAKWFCGMLGMSLMALQLQAGDVSFTNLMVRAEQAEESGKMQAAEQFYGEAERSESNDASGLCVLTKKYCDLMYQATPVDTQKRLLARAMACARQAVKIDPDDSVAHASLAVCDAKACAFADVKDRVAYSRAIKEEAETAVRLNPKQDVAYYLLGRWNFAVANVGLIPRAYVRIVYGGLPRASNGEAIQDFKRAIALAPDHAIYHLGLAKVYEATGQKALADAELKQCAALKPLDREDEEAQANAREELGATSQ